MNRKDKNRMLALQAKYINISACTALIASGILLLALPNLPTVALRLIFGILFVFSGGAKLLGYFSNDLYRLAFQFDLGFGCFSALIGAFVLLAPERGLSILPSVIGIFVTADGLLKLQIGVDARRFGISRWLVILLSAAGTALIGILTVAAPYLPILGEWVMLAVSLIADGVENIWITAYTVRVRTYLFREKGRPKKL